MDFDWDNIEKFLPYLIPLAIWFLFNILFKKQKQQQTQQAVVRSLIAEIEHNSRLAESYALRSQTKKFKTAVWERNRDKMDYIPQQLYSNLEKAYAIADGFNREIDWAKKSKTTSYMPSINTTKLLGPLAGCKKGLEEWIELNKAKKTVEGAKT